MASIVPCEGRPAQHTKPGLQGSSDRPRNRADSYDGSNGPLLGSLISRNHFRSTSGFTAAEAGRGLVIVDALSTRWGVDPHQPRGKIVWSHFLIALPATAVRVVEGVRPC